MQNQIEPGNILYLDIETAPLVYRYTELDEATKTFWNLKWRYNADLDPEKQYEKAGIYAEFARVVCICVGFFNGAEFHLKSFSALDEKVLLSEFAEFVSKHYSGPRQMLCAHNGKEFDFPFLCRRMIINRLTIPETLQIAGKKPWEVKHLDTMELWKFGDYKSYTSLNLLAHVLGIPTPKDEIDGSMVAKTYYEEKDLEKIVRYCYKDVITVARIVQRFINGKEIKDEVLRYL